LKYLFAINKADGLSFVTFTLFINVSSYIKCVIKDESVQFGYPFIELLKVRYPIGGFCINEMIVLSLVTKDSAMDNCSNNALNV
jgi:hypothetical protein